MSLPECVLRLLPDNLPLEVLHVTEAWPRWSVQGVTLTPIFRNRNNSIAVSNAEREIKILSPHSERESVWVPINQLQEAIDIARYLKLGSVGISGTEINGTLSPLLSLVGKDSQVVISIAPHLTWQSDDEDEVV